ncbi:TniB family NTP-binding protein [Streptomyces sp. NPDC101152]|uniref:TniB family NTP-binding protein n=1 Tax=Streptomyces sp. NPDC101152 TaxID=3366116 RepID=UPI0037F8AB5E
MTSHDAAPAVKETSPGTVTTFDAFARFATTAPPTPPQPDQPPRPAEERLAYHSQFVTVRTPAIETLSRSVRTLMILGRHQQVTARPSLIVTGPATTGKTTALLEVGRTCHLAHTRRAAPGDDSVPVAYVLVPPGAKTPAGEFARYLGIPTTTRMTTTQITTAVCHTYTAARVKLVLIDEIHRLNPRTSSGAEAADWLKDRTGLGRLPSPLRPRHPPPPDPGQLRLLLLLGPMVRPTRTPECHRARSMSRGGAREGAQTNHTGPNSLAGPGRYGPSVPGSPPPSPSTGGGEPGRTRTHPPSSRP